MAWPAMQGSIDLIAPCGIYCGLCMKYLERELPPGITKSGPCPGCRVRNKTCAFLKKGCPYLPKRELTFCFDCPEFPCERLTRLDATYRKDYRHGLIENLEFMKEKGVDAFLARVEGEHRCNTCGHLQSIHNGFCYGCGKETVEAYIKARNTAIRKRKTRA